MKFSFKRIFSFVLAFAMVISLVPEIGPLFTIKANAATTKDFTGSTVTDLGMSATNADGSGTPTASWTANGNTITGSLVGGTGSNGVIHYYYESTTVLTLTNNKEVEAELSFKYSVTTKGSAFGDITVNGTKHTASDENKSVTAVLAAGASITITLHVPQRDQWFKLPDANGASITITDLSLIVEDSTTVTFGEAQNGSYTVTDASGAAVTVPSSVTAKSTDQFTLTATPASGYAFSGWYSGDTFLSGNATWNKKFDTNMTVAPKFVPTEDGVFGVGGAVFTSLANAITAAESSTKTVILLKDHVLSGAHTIPKGVTLLIPKDDDQTTPYGENLEAGPYRNDQAVLVDKNGSAVTVYSKPVAFRTLSLASDATLTINGNLEASAIHYQIQGGPIDGGAVYGTYGRIDMAEGSEIILNDGANLYAWGYVLGDGIVTANSGATVYEKMQVTDYCGGRRTSSIVGILNKGKKVFPFSQYYVQNVEAETVLKQGSTIKAHAAIYSSDGAQSTVTKFIGEGAMFSMGSDTVLTKKYDRSTDRLIISAKGENTANSTVELNSIALEMEGIAIDSSEFVLPINSNITIELNDCTATVNQEMLLQPGVKISLNENAYININANVYVFDIDQWSTYVFRSRLGGATAVPLSYLPGPDGASTRTISSDAVIDLNGTLIANAGIYTTEGGAQIISSENTGRILFNTAASSGSVNQVSGEKSVLGYFSDAIFTELPAVPALLANGGAATPFTSTEGAAAGDIFVYDSLLDMWVKPTGDMELNYDANGGTGGPGKQVVTLDGLKGGTESNELQIPSTVPTKTNAKFLGWALSADGDAVLQPGDFVTIGQTHTLYAKWEITHYTITFLNEDGSVFETLTVPVGQTPTAGTPTKADNTQYTYNFAGWDADGDGKADDVVAADADATYKAVYNESLREYKITWMDANGTELYSYMMPYGTQIIEPDTNPTKAKDDTYHYTFVGWDSNNDGAADAIGTVSDAVTYVPVFAAEAHSYGDGVVTKEPTTTEEGIKTYTCSACGNSYTESIDKLVDMLYTAKTLFLKGAVSINVYLAFEGHDFLTQEYIMANGGLLVWKDGELPADVNDAIYGSQSYIADMEYSGPYKGHVEYMATTAGIPAKEYGDKLYFRSYILVGDEYQYGELQEFSVKEYCELVFAKSTSKATLKNTLVALLNYGAAAQTYLKYKTDMLVNADIATYLENGWITEAMTELNWDNSYLTALKQPGEEMVANFAATESITSISKTLFLKGAISVNYYVGVDNATGVFTNAQSQKMYFWTEADYTALSASGTALTKENASYKVESELEYSSKYGYEFFASSNPIAAKNWGDTLYAALCVTDSEGNEHCSGVITFSPAEYASIVINDEKTADIDDVCKWMVVYSQRAIEYFNS